MLVTNKKVHLHHQLNFLSPSTYVCLPISPASTNFTTLESLQPSRGSLKNVEQLELHCYFFSHFTITSLLITFWKLSNMLLHHLSLYLFWNKSWLLKSWRFSLLCDAAQCSDKHSCHATERILGRLTISVFSKLVLRDHCFSCTVKCSCCSLLDNLHVFTRGAGQKTGKSKDFRNLFDFCQNPNHNLNTTQYTHNWCWVWYDYDCSHPTHPTTTRNSTSAKHSTQGSVN